MEAHSWNVVADSDIYHSMAAVEGSDWAGGMLLGEKSWV